MIYIIDPKKSGKQQIYKYPEDYVPLRRHKLKIQKIGGKKKK